MGLREGRGAYLVFSEAVEARCTREPWIAILLVVFGLFPSAFLFLCPLYYSCTVWVLMREPAT